MFQFRRFPTYAYLIQRRMAEYCSAGFPHSEICGSKLMCSSPQLIAACHVLLRLLMPRHSPCALYSLTLVEQPFLSCSLFDHELCRPHRSFAIGYIVLPYLKFHNIAVLPSVACSCTSSFTLFSFQGADFPTSFKVRLKHLFSRCFNPISNLYGNFLCLLSFSKESKWWAQVDSNHRPHDYQSCALAS